MTRNFVVHKRSKSDEDAEPISDNKMIIICDGLGAAGMNKHQINGEVCSSAYLGSRLVSQFVSDFFHQQENYDLSWRKENTELLVRKLKDDLCQRMSQFIAGHQLKKTIIGSAAKLLPTTLAMALYRENADSIDVLVIWAGDSRIYLLSSAHGLQQLSRDDVRGEFDAMASLGTSDMVNQISGEGEEHFHINYARYMVAKEKNLILFGTSDGSFDYLASPMEFEYVLESAIQQIQDRQDSSVGLEEIISSYYSESRLKDDTTIAGIILDSTDSRCMKKQYEKRYQFMRNHYQEKTRNYLQRINEKSQEKDSMTVPVSKGIRDLKNALLRKIADVIDKEHPSGIELQFRELISQMKCMQSFLGEDTNVQERYITAKNRKKQLEREKQAADQEVLDYFRAVGKYAQKGFPEDFTRYFINCEEDDDRLEKVADGNYREYVRYGNHVSNMKRFSEIREMSRNYRMYTMEDWADQRVRLCKIVDSIRVPLANNTPVECWQQMKQTVDKNFLMETISQFYDSGERIFEMRYSHRELLFAEIKGALNTAGIVNYAKDNCREYQDRDEFSQMRRLLCNIHDCQKEIKEIEEHMKEIHKRDSAKYIKNLNNTFWEEFIQINKIEDYAGTARKQLVNLKEAYMKQQRCKEEIAGMREHIIALWNSYQKEYERYRSVKIGSI